VFQTVTKIKGNPDCGYDRHKPESSRNLGSKHLGYSGHI
jgi:hypothetical protein